jgi:regulator of sirC expression with transglutaminase-like and TPR domain
MLSPTPLCCSPRAYNLLNSLRPSLNSPDGLLQGAVAIAMHQMDDIDPAAVDLTLQGYADTVRSRVRGSQPQAMLAHLHELLFEEEGFTGNSDDYYNPMNSYLPAVLQSKRGLPITLSLVYKIVAERLGLRVYGVALPGHFLVGLEVDETRTLVDPFSGGRLLNEDEARDRLMQMFGPEADWSDEMLQPAVCGRGRGAGDGNAPVARPKSLAARSGSGTGPLRLGAPGIGVAGSLFEDESR